MSAPVPRLLPACSVAGPAGAGPLDEPAYEGPAASDRGDGDEVPPADDPAPRLVDGPEAPDPAPLRGTPAGAGAVTGGADGVETVGAGRGGGLGTETVGTVGVGGVGVETDGVGTGTVGTGTVGTVTVGTVTVGTLTVGTVTDGTDVMLGTVSA